MAGAAKPGSTLPPQGGKGGVQSPRPTLAPPGQGSTLPPQGGKGGAQPGQVPPRTLGGYSPADIDRLMANQVPAQVQQPAPGQVPAQGGKAQNPDGTRTGTLPGYAQPYVNSMMDQPQVQQPAPGQVPAQGGKGGGQSATPEQLAALQAQLDASRLPPTTTTPSNLPGYAPSRGQSATPEQLAALQAQLDASRPVPQVQQPLGLAGRPEIQAAYGQPQVQQPLVRQPAPVPGLGLSSLLKKPMPKLKGRR